MALFKSKARQLTAVERVSEGADVYLRALRDGTVSVADWLGVMSLEGRVFTANVGTGTSAATFGATTLDTTEFDLHVAVPSSAAIIPLECSVIFDALGTAQIVEVVMQAGSGSTCGAGTAITPVSSNVSAGRTSACTVTSVATATSGVAIATNVREIWHDENPLGITVATVGQVRQPHVFRYFAKNSGALEVVGPSQQLAVYASAQAGTGFIKLVWVELPASAVN